MNKEQEIFYQIQSVQEAKELLSSMRLISESGDASLFSMRNDIIFRAVLCEEERVIRSILKAFLNLSDADLESVTILDPKLEAKYPDDKYSILDIKVKTASGEIINIEMQVRKVAGILKRILFYATRNYSDQLKSGVNYTELNKVQCVLIADFTLFKEDKDYQHDFHLYDKKHDLYYPDSLAIHVIELPKVPDDDNSLSGLWARFLKARTTEETAMLASLEPDIEVALERIKILSRNEETRRQAEALEKGLMDFVTSVTEARREGKAEEKIEIAMNLIALGTDFRTISIATGLSLSQIQELAKKQ